MRYIKQRQTKFVAAVVGMIVMAIAASRQLYLFVIFRNAEGFNDAPKVLADMQTAAVRNDSSPDTSVQNQVNATYQQPAVIRVLPLHESGIPYASRST